jgi:hypothetical protein
MHDAGEVAAADLHGRLVLGCSCVARVGKRLEGTAAGLDCVGVFFLRLGAGFLGNQTHGNVMA